VWIISMKKGWILDKRRVS